MFVCSLLNIYLRFLLSEGKERLPPDSKVSLVLSHLKLLVMTLNYMGSVSVLSQNREG